MRRNYSKEDVDIRYERGVYRPTINVKVYNFPRSSVVEDRFKCSLVLPNSQHRACMSSALCALK